jgi:hypothetical protein
VRLPHSLILHKYFRQPSELIGPGDSRQSAGWAAALGEPFESAIQRLIQEGYLKPSETVEPLPSLLEFAFSVTQLRSLLQGKRLKSSGQKSELAARLAANDPDLALAALGALNHYSRSRAGDQFAGVFVARDEIACEEAIRAFQQGKYAEAIEIARGFDRELGFPTYEYFGQIRPPEWFRCLAAARPRILGSLPGYLLDELRTETLLGELGLGKSRLSPQKWGPGEGQYSHLERKYARNMLGFSANHIYGRTQALRLGAKRFQIRGARNVNSSPAAPENPCPVCANLDGTVWEVDLAPELPHAECTHRYGCRCEVRPVSE